jgi:hypothetical protein
MLIRRNQVVAASIVVLSTNVWFMVQHTGSRGPTMATHTALTASLPRRPSLDTAGSPGVASPGRVVNEAQPRDREETAAAPPSLAVRPPSSPKVPRFSALRFQHAIERVRTKSLAGVGAKVDSASRVVDVAPPTFRNP